MYKKLTTIVQRATDQYVVYVSYHTLPNNTAKMPKLSDVACLLRHKCKPSMLKANDPLGDTLRAATRFDACLRARLGANRDAVVLLMFSPTTGRSARVDHVHASFRKHSFEPLGDAITALYDTLTAGNLVLAPISLTHIPLQILAIDARAYAWLERTFPAACLSDGMRLSQALLKRVISRRVLPKSKWFVGTMCETSMLAATCDAFTRNFCDGCHAKRADGVSLRPCGGCGVPHYCSAKCQRQQWRKCHRDHCKGPSTLGGSRRINPDEWRSFCKQYTGPTCAGEPIV